MFAVYLDVAERFQSVVNSQALDEKAGSGRIIPAIRKNADLEQEKSLHCLYEPLRKNCLLYHLRYHTAKSLPRMNYVTLLCIASQHNWSVRFKDL